MEDDIQRTVYRIVADVTGEDVAVLNERSRFSDLVDDEDDFHQIYERLCEELNVPLAAILNTMPVYRVVVGDLVLNSWRNLAPFSKTAARLLNEHDVRMECETLGSLAETMRQGRYVSSGEFWPSVYPPRSMKYVLGWAGGITAASVFLPLAFTFLPCNPVCSDCTLSTWAQMREMLPFSLAIGFLLNAIAFVPGIYAMRRAPEPSPRQQRALKDVRRKTTSPAE